MKLSKDATLFLGQLRNDQKFRHVMRELKSLRPVIPAYQPQVSQEANQQLLEQIKFDSGQVKGFDSIYRFLTGDVNG